MTHSRKAHGAGQGTPTNDEGPTVAAVAPQANTQDSSPDSHGAPLVGQALRTIEGESKAREYIARLQAEQADPDELALIVSMLYGAALRGVGRVIAKALGVQHV